MKQGEMTSLVANTSPYPYSKGLAWCVHYLLCKNYPQNKNLIGRTQLTYQKI